MKSCNLLSVIACLVGTSLSVQANELPDIKEGLWEISSTAEMTGMPFAMPPMAHVARECLTKQMATDPNTLLKGQNCEMTNMNIQSSHVTWNMRCDQQGMSMTGSGSADYQYESFNGVFNITMQGGGGSMSMVTKSTGRYIGACH